MNDLNNVRAVFDEVLQNGEVRLGLSLIRSCTYWWKGHLTTDVPHDAIPAIPGLWHRSMQELGFRQWRC